MGLMDRLFLLHVWVRDLENVVYISRSKRLLRVSRGKSESAQFSECWFVLSMAMNNCFPIPFP